MPDQTITTRLADALREWNLSRDDNNPDLALLAEYDAAHAAGTLPEQSEAKYNRVVSLAVDKGKTLIAQRDAANADAERLATACKATKSAYSSRQLYDKCPIDLIETALAAHAERTKGEQNAK